MKPLNYAVIREDARIEGDLVWRTGAKRVLTVASGGCVALSLSARFPGVAITAFDTSLRQLEHVAAKKRAAQAGDRALLNVEAAERTGLNQCGEFERVFRLMRAFFEELVAPHEELLAFFVRGRKLDELDDMVRRWSASRYWVAAFQACFSEELLQKTLGTRIMQHASPGSYPKYFQRALERGLRRDNAPENPFLQHIFLGGYRRGCEPFYLRNPGAFDIALVEGDIASIADLDAFDVVSMSNLFDALTDDEAQKVASVLTTRMRPGAALLVRGMNNARPVRPFLEPAFKFDSSLGRSYFLRDRSLFYDRFEVGFRQ